jgi:hypothetical protein
MVMAAWWGLISRGDVLRWMRDGATGDELLRDVALEVATAYPDGDGRPSADRMPRGAFPACR